jgi:transposase InsO family protein
MIHGNAPLTPAGRRCLAVLIIEEGWTVRRTAERFQCSPATASRWSRRYRAGMPLTDRSSRPRRSSSRMSKRTERRIIALRFTQRWGPHRIGYHLHLPRSTAGRVLARYRMPPLAHLDQAAGLPVRRPKPCATRWPGRENWYMSTSRSWAASLTVAGGTAVATPSCTMPSTMFRGRARAFFADLGVSVDAVLTDNGACYRSRAFSKVLGDATHRRTRPHRPQTNGKVERFNRTLAAEWAYARTYLSDEARAAT